MEQKFLLVIFLALIFGSMALSHKQSTTTTNDSPHMEDTAPPADNTQNSPAENTALPVDDKQAVPVKEQGFGMSEPQTDFKNISNLNAGNWIIGDQSIDDYNKELFTFITHNNVTKCPISTPFLRNSDSLCVNCEGEKPVFDLKLKDCVTCPEGMVLNNQTHKCEEGAPAPPVSKCTSNYVWNEEQQKCVCPEAFPIDLECECVSCLEPFVWNADEQVCKLRCNQTQVWNSGTKTCECPTEAPYKINGECIACNGPFKWNAQLNTCELKVNACKTPEGEITPVTPSTSTNQTVPSTNQTVPSTNQTVPSTSTNQTVPSTSTNQTVPSTSTNQTVPSTSTNQTAPSTSTPSTSTNQTAPSTSTPSTSTNQTAPSTSTSTPSTSTTTQPSLETQTCGSNFLWDNNVQKCVCPYNLPFNDGTKCVQCNLPQYWDDDFKQCLYCEENTYFNPISRSCQPCPADRPMFSNYTCQACPEGTYYNPGSNTCQYSTFGASKVENVPVYTPQSGY